MAPGFSSLETGQSTDIDAYVQAMNGFGTDTRFYLASDFQQVVEQLQDVFGERIHLYPRRAERGRSRRYVEATPAVDWRPFGPEGDL